MQDTLKNMPREARIELLKTSADSIEDTTYYKALTPELLDIKREQLTDNCIKLSEYEDELKLVKDDFKIKMDPLKTDNKKLLVEVKTRQEQVTGTLYHMANHESGFMETYDHDGELISTRRLRPDEKQKSIFSLNKTA